MKVHIKKIICILIIGLICNLAYAKSLIVNTSDNTNTDQINILIYNESEGSYYNIANYQCRSGEKIPLELPEEENAYVIVDHPSYALYIDRLKSSDPEDKIISLEKGSQIMVEIHDYAGNPLQGVHCMVEIQIQPFGHRVIRKSATDETGKTVLKNLISLHTMDIIELSHEITLTKEGYFTETRYIDIKDHKFELIPENAIFGRVENINGYPAEGVILTLRDAGNGIIKETVSGPDGKFILILNKEQSSGTFQMQFSSHGLINEQTQNDIFISKDPYIFQVDYVFAVQGTVVNESFDTVEKFLVSLGVFSDDFRPAPNKRLFNDKEGRFCIGLGSHAIHDSYNYYIEIFSEKHGKQYQVINLKKGLNDLGEIQLKMAPGLEGKVIDYYTSRPVKDVKICLLDEGNESASQMNRFTRNCHSIIKTDEDGKFSINNLGGNTYRALFEKEGYAPLMSDTFTVPEDRNYDMKDIKLSKGNRVIGEIKARNLQEDEIDFSSMRIIAEDGPGLFPGEFREGTINRNSFAIMMLARGRYRVKLYYKGIRYYKYVTFNEECCATEKIDFYIGGTDVSGFVYLAGEPIPDTKITFTQDSSIESPDHRPHACMDPFIPEIEMYGYEKTNTYESITDANGRYSITQVEPGSYIIEFNKFYPGFKLPDKDIHVEDVAYMQYDIHIKGAVIKLNIRNDQNEPVSASVIVKPKNETDTGRYHFSTSDPAGHSVITITEMGTYDIQIGGVDNYEPVYIEDIIIDAYEQEYEFDVMVEEKIILQ